MDKSPTKSTDTWGKDLVVDMGDFSTANSVHTYKMKKNFFSKLFTCGWFSTPITFDSLSTHSPYSPVGLPIENVLANCDIEEVADNFSFFDTKYSKD